MKFSGPGWMWDAIIRTCVEVKRGLYVGET